VKRELDGSSVEWNLPYLLFSYNLQPYVLQDRCIDLYNLTIYDGSM